MGYKKHSVTLKEIAQILGLSVKAVSTGLNNTGRLAPETRKRIQETAWRMGYTPNVAARALVTHRSNFVGVVMPFLNSSFFSNIIAGIEEVAGQNDFTLLLDSFSSDPIHQQRTLARLIQRGVDGMILYPQKNCLHLTKQICAMGVPIVQIMNWFDELGESAVMVDNFNGGRNAARHLVGLGHTRIGLIGHDSESSELIRRRQGFESIIDEYQLSDSLIKTDAVLSVAGGCQAGYTILTQTPAPTAIFACSDAAALGVMQTALSLKLRIPEDLSVLGFDDLELAARQLVYPLTTMAQPKEQIGRLAAEMLLQLLHGTKTPPVMLTAPLIVRNTTSRPGNDRSMTGPPPCKDKNTIIQNRCRSVSLPQIQEEKEQVFKN